MSIRDKIYNYFDSTADLRVLFVFDAMGMLRNEIEAIDEPWKDGYVYKSECFKKPETSKARQV